MKYSFSMYQTVHIILQTFFFHSAMFLKVYSVDTCGFYIQFIQFKCYIYLTVCVHHSLTILLMDIWFFFNIYFYLFWLCWRLSCSKWDLHVRSSLWYAESLVVAPGNLVSWPQNEPGPPALSLEAWPLDHQGSPIGLFLNFLVFLTKLPFSFILNQGSAITVQETATYFCKQGFMRS